MCDEQPSLIDRCDELIIDGKYAELDSVLNLHAAQASTCPTCSQSAAFYRAVWLGEERHEFENSNMLLSELIDSPLADERLRTRAMNYMAMNLDRLDRYSESLRVYQRAAARCRQSGDAQGLARALFNQAIVLNNRLRNHTAALALLDEAESAICDTDSPIDIIRILNERGVALINAQRWDEALAALRETHTRCERLSNPYLLAICEINLGNWERLRGDLQAGAQWCSQALARLGGSGELCAEALFYRSQIAQQQDRSDDAEADLREMLRLAQESGSQHFTALAYIGMARLAARRADDTQALAHYGEAVQEIEQIRSAQDISAVRLDFQAQWQAMYPEAIACALRLGRTAESLLLSEHGRSRLLLDTIGWPQDDLDALPDDQRAELEQLQRDLHNGYTRQLTGQLDQAGKDALHALEQRIAVRRADYHRRAQELLPTRAPATLEQLQAALPPQAAILSYVDAGDHLCVFLIDQAGVRQRKLGISSAQVQVRLNASGQVRDLLPDPRTGRLSRNLRVLHLLHDGLLAPVADWLADIATIYVVPDLRLRHIPFHLLTPGPGQPCPLTADARQLRYLPSASVLTHIAPLRRDGALLTIGNNQPNLHLVEPHIRRIAALGGGKALGGSAAEHRAVVQALDGAAQVYFAGHNTFHPHAPLDSGLHLGNQGSTRLLTLSDIRRLHLTGSQIILSACQSSLVAERGGDWIGLISALLQARAAQIVGSLWNVSEVATCALMDAFWATLGSGQDPQAALQQAQEHLRVLTPEAIRQSFSTYDLTPPARSYLDSQISALVGALDDPTHPLDHPYYWGPFIVLGI